MDILTRLHWFISSAVIAAIVAVIVLVLLRLIAEQANPNPFGWPARTIRRLTDPLVGPVRRALVWFRRQSQIRSTGHNSADDPSRLVLAYNS